MKTLVNFINNLDEAGQSADTFGWDTVFAIRFGDVNSAIAKAGASPTNFDRNDSSSSVNYRIQGSWQDWALTIGGDGRNVFMMLPVPTMTYSEDSTDYPLDNLRVEIEVQLEFLPQPDANTGLLDLKMRTPNPAANAVITVREIHFDGAQPPSPIAGAVIRGLFEMWLNDPQNIQEFNHVFASVNLNQKADKGELQWLMPTHTSYAVIDRESMETSVFAVLCMTENRDPAGLAHQVSPFAIAEGERSGFLISQERFLRKMMLPGIGLLFNGPEKMDPHKTWPDDYFELTDDDTAITNNAKIVINQLNIKDEASPEYVKADVDKGNYTLRLENTKLSTEIKEMHYQSKFLNMGWIDVYQSINSNSTARLNDNQIFDLAEGKGSIHAVAVKDPTARWIEIGLLAASLVIIGASAARWGYMRFVAQEAQVAGDAAAVAGEVIPAGGQAAAADAAGGAGAAAGAIAEAPQAANAWWSMNRAFRIANIIGATSGAGIALMEILERLADQDAQKDLPKFNEFAASAMKPVQWPSEESEYQVSDVAFNRSFQVSGNPGFAD